MTILIARRCLYVSLLIANIGVFAACSTKHVVRPASQAGDSQESGVFYALPRTVIVVDLPVIRKDIAQSMMVTRAIKDGEIQELKDAAYRELGLDAKEVFDRGSQVSFELGEIAIGAQSEPDPLRVYFVELSGGFFKNRNFTMNLTEQGLLTSVESSVEDKSFELAVKTLEAGASIAGKALRGFVGALTGPTGTPLTKTYDRVIAQIVQLRQYRLELVSGKSGVSSLNADTFDRMLKQLDVMEDELMRNFTGVVKTTAVKLRFEVRPEPKDVGNPIHLFDFSEAGGISVGLATGVLKPIIPTKLSEQQPRQGVYILLTLAPPGGEQLATRVQTPTTGERSYYYRVPASVLTQVISSDGKREFASRQLAVAQFGATVSLPVAIAGASSKFKPTFYVGSGALKDLSVEAKVPDLAAIGAIGAAGGTIVDATAERERLKKAEKDELNRLKREADILEQRERIKSLEKKLGINQ